MKLLFQRNSIEVWKIFIETLEKLYKNSHFWHFSSILGDFWKRSKNEHFWSILDCYLSNRWSPGLRSPAPDLKVVAMLPWLLGFWQSQWAASAWQGSMSKLSIILLCCQQNTASGQYPNGKTQWKISQKMRPKGWSKNGANCGTHPGVNENWGAKRRKTGLKRQFSKKKSPILEQAWSQPLETKRKLEMKERRAKTDDFLRAKAKFWSQNGVVPWSQNGVDVGGKAGANFEQKAEEQTWSRVGAKWSQGWSKLWRQIGVEVEEKACAGINTIKF
jgi:hypothetical protein